MNQDVLKKWVAELRSGKYNQGEGHLMQIDDDGDEHFCCLGVLCEIALDEGVPNLERVYNEDARRYFYNEREDFLPEPVIEWVGFNSKNPGVPYVQSDDDSETVDDKPLSELNDEGLSFAAIADLIEQEWIVKE